MSYKKLYIMFRERYFRRETFSANVCRSPINVGEFHFVFLRLSVSPFVSLFLTCSISLALFFPAVTTTSLHHRTLSPPVSQSMSAWPNLDSSLLHSVSVFQLSHRSDQIRRNWFTRVIHSGRTHRSYFFEAYIFLY